MIISEQKVADPYRRLEDADSEATRIWIEAENKLNVQLSGGDS